MGIPVEVPVRMLGDNQGVLESTTRYAVSRELVLPGKLEMTVWKWEKL